MKHEEVDQIVHRVQEAREVLRRANDDWDKVKIEVRRIVETCSRKYCRVKLIAI